MRAAEALDWDAVLAIAARGRGALPTEKTPNEVIDGTLRAVTRALDVKRLDAAAAILGTVSTVDTLTHVAGVTMALVEGDAELALAHLALVEPFLLSPAFPRLCELLADETARALVAKPSTRRLGAVAIGLKIGVCDHHHGVELVKMCMNRQEQVFELCATEQAEHLFSPGYAERELVEWVSAAAHRRFERSVGLERLRAFRALALVERAEGRDIAPYVERLEHEWAARPHMLEALEREIKKTRGA